MKTARCLASCALCTAAQGSRSRSRALPAAARRYRGELHRCTANDCGSNRPTRACRTRARRICAPISTSWSTTLDDSSLRAVLKLMISESRGAVRKQQQLIALERLVGREAAGRMDRLRELEAAQKQLTAFYASHAESEDEGTDDQGLDEGAPPRAASKNRCTVRRRARQPHPACMRSSRLGTIRKEPGTTVDVFPRPRSRGACPRGTGARPRSTRSARRWSCPLTPSSIARAKRPTYLYYLELGAMTIGATSPDGEQAVVAVHGPGISSARGRSATKYTTPRRRRCCRAPSFASPSPRCRTCCGQIRCLPGSSRST